MTDCLIELSVPAADVLLADTLAALEDATLELGLPTSHSANYTSFLVSRGVDHDALIGQLEVDRSIDAVRAMDIGNPRSVYQVGWTPRDASVFNVLAGDEASVLRAVGREERWTMMIAIESADYETIRTLVEQRGPNWRIQDTYRSDGSRPNDGSGSVPLRLDEILTTTQRDTLDAALALGYFEIPRGISMQELADELSVTPNAVSERLRRAQEAVFTELLADGTS